MPIKGFRYEGLRLKASIDDDMIVFFNGTRIGRTSASFAKALEAGFRETNKNKNIPAYLNSVYVSALTTVIRPEEESAENV